MLKNFVDNNANRIILLSLLLLIFFFLSWLLLFFWLAGIINEFYKVEKNNFHILLKGYNIDNNSKETYKQLY